MQINTQTRSPSTSLDTISSSNKEKKTKQKSKNSKLSGTQKKPHREVIESLPRRIRMQMW